MSDAPWYAASRRFGMANRTFTRRRQINRTVFADGQRVVLFNWGANAEPRLRNVAALDRDGSTLWTADLPADTGRDCFVKLETSGRLLFATTFLGHIVRLCPATGAHLN